MIPKQSEEALKAAQSAAVQKVTAGLAEEMLIPVRFTGSRRPAIGCDPWVLALSAFFQRLSPD